MLVSESWFGEFGDEQRDLWELGRIQAGKDWQCRVWLAETGETEECRGNELFPMLSEKETKFKKKKKAP